MNLIKKIGGYSINEGNLQSSGLFNVTTESGAVSHWFNADTKDDLLNSEELIFYLKCDEMLDYSETLNTVFTDFNPFVKERGCYKSKQWVLPKTIKTTNGRIKVGDTRYMFISGTMHSGGKCFAYVTIHTGAVEFKKFHKSGSMVEFDKIHFSAKNMEELISKLKNFGVIVYHNENFLNFDTSEIKMSVLKIVGVYKESNLNDAFSNSQNHDYAWTSSEKFTNVISDDLRSTSVGDVLKMNGKFYVVANVGFIEMKLVGDTLRII